MYTINGRVRNLIVSTSLKEPGSRDTPLPPVKKTANPLIIMYVEKVTKKGLILNLSIKKPLVKPTAAPITVTISNPTNGLTYKPEAKTEAPHSQALNIAPIPATDSMERSKLPLIKQ